MGGTPFSDRITQYVDLVLKALEIVYRANNSAVEEFVDINGHKIKEVGEVESVSWGGTRTKYEGLEYNLTKKMFYHKDLLQLCLNKERNITELFSDTNVSYD